MLGYIVLALLLAFLSVILIRAALFNPKKEEKIEAEKIELNEQKIISDMADMIKCKTVSYRDNSLEDEAEFEKFRELLKERFPLVHLNSELKKIGRNGLLYKIKGEKSDSPSVCMAHYDVVPVNEEGWEKPAFEAIVENGFIWGRGTLDTKGTLCALLQALEKLISEGYKPKNDLYLSFSGEEEIDGDSCKDIVLYLEENGVKPAFVLDEGGAVVNKVFPGVNKPSAMIGVAEKGSMNLKFMLDSEGGHASTPPTRTTLGRLSEAVVRIEKHPFKFQLVKPVYEMFDTLGRHSSFAMKIIFANLWCFSPILNLICKMSGGEFGAMVRTTVATTRMQGSDAYNVLPPKASFGVNMRLLGEDTTESAEKYLKKIIKNPKIKTEFISGMNPSIYSDTKSEGYKKLSQAIKESWEDVIVTPYLMMACSDSRHYCRITDKVYRFSAMSLSKEERAMIHGNNERVPIETLIKSVEFYVRLLKML